MSRIVVVEVAMKKELPELYDIYFGGKVLLHYEEDIPLIVVETTSNMGQEAAFELNLYEVLNNLKLYESV